MNSRTMLNPHGIFQNPGHSRIKAPEFRVLHHNEA
jgi:hypothetical protein